MYNAVYLPKLNKLTPTLDSTLLKAVEESGELARAILKFLPFEQSMLQKPADLAPYGRELLADVAGELMDVAQVCVTMIFVMEEHYAINVGKLLDKHLDKLAAKGYGFAPAGIYQISTSGNFKRICLPKLDIEDVTLLTTVCKIQEELGELTQFLGKQAGASGEKKELSNQAILEGCALELLDVAQCCFTMMYILAEKYAVNTDKLVERHISKLQRKGYCA